MCSTNPGGQFTLESVLLNSVPTEVREDAISRLYTCVEPHYQVTLCAQVGHHLQVHVLPFYTWYRLH